MKVIVDIFGGKLAIEGDGPELLKVLEAARTLAPNVSQIQLVTSSSNRDLLSTEGEVSPNSQHTMPTNRSASAKTLRQFVRALSLNNASEKIGAIAYYVNKIEGKPSFAPKDMDGWFTMCGFQKPTQMSVALYDAKRKYGYAENFGRGMWRISTQGENLIIAKIEDSDTRNSENGIRSFGSQS